MDLQRVPSQRPWPPYVEVLPYALVWERPGVRTSDEDQAWGED